MLLLRLSNWMHADRADFFGNEPLVPMYIICAEPICILLTRHV